MDARTYDLKLVLLNEYVPVIAQSLQRQSKKGHFIGKDKAITKLLGRYQSGSVTLEEAQQILAHVWADCNERLSKPGAGGIGEAAVLSGARNDLALIVKEFTDQEKTHPGYSSDGIMCQVLAVIWDRRNGR